MNESRLYVFHVLVPLDVVTVHSMAMGDTANNIGRAEQIVPMYKMKLIQRNLMGRMFAQYTKGHGILQRRKDSIGGLLVCFEISSIEIRHETLFGLIGSALTL